MFEHSQVLLREAVDERLLPGLFGSPHPFQAPASIHQRPDFGRSQALAALDFDDVEPQCGVLPNHSRMKFVAIGPMDLDSTPSVVYRCNACRVINPFEVVSTANSGSRCCIFSVTSPVRFGEHCSLFCFQVPEKSGTVISAIKPSEAIAIKNRFIDPQVYEIIASIS
jgi:hypothetical protein